MKYDAVIVGSGFGSLTAGALLVKRGLKVCVLEQAKYPGGCASSFKRKGYWFETGATTLVGLDQDMPLRYLLDQIKVEVPVRKLEIPMQVHLPNGQVLTRYPDLQDWIQEAERVFGRSNQRGFWEYCYRVSRQVWRTSLQQQSFPFSSFGDIWTAFKSARPQQLKLIPGAYRSMQDVLQKYGLLQNRLFVQFVNEQLLITAQNYLGEVNALFGATALCYTLYSNYYVDGGLINLVKPIADYITANGSEILLGQSVQEIGQGKNGYLITSSKGIFESRFVICGIPLNNILAIFKDERVKEKLQPYCLPSPMLNGAFTMGLVLEGHACTKTLHHQVHVLAGLPLIGSKSIFVSLAILKTPYVPLPGEQSSLSAPMWLTRSRIISTRKIR